MSVRRNLQLPCPGATARVASNAAGAYHPGMMRSAHCLSRLVPIAPVAVLCLGLAGACIEETGRITDTSDADASGDVGEPCDEPGVTRCASDAAATEVCLNGTWQRAACAENKICVLAGGAQCVDSTGDAACRDTLYCFLGCQVAHADDPVAAEACLVECFRSATQAAQRELSEVSECFEDNCGNDAGLDCVAEQCSQDLARCYYDSSGDATCGSIVECRVGCNEDPSCIQACGADATVGAQGEYAVLELCIFYACAGQDDECGRRAGLPTGACGDYTNACIGLLPNTPR